MIATAGVAGVMVLTAQTTREQCQRSKLTYDEQTFPNLVREE
jgi:hypothetical protein